MDKKIGVLYCGYNCEEHLSSLNTWTEWRMQDPQNRAIAAVSIPFKEYKDFKYSIDNTHGILAEKLKFQAIDALFIEPQHISEAEARNLGIKHLLETKCDYIILADADEHYKLIEIDAIIDFIGLDPWCSWFSFSLKNYVFDSKTYIVEPFTPPRAFRVNTNGHELQGLYWDNDPTYVNSLTGAAINYKALPNKVIPAHVAFPKHLTWLSNEKSKLKCDYQQSHFKGICGYRWNELTDNLEFNPDYYSKIGQPFPKLAKEHG